MVSADLSGTGYNKEVEYGLEYIHQPCGDHRREILHTVADGIQNGVQYCSIGCAGSAQNDDDTLCHTDTHGSAEKIRGTTVKRARDVI